jgi:hypothetical protein
VIGLIYLIVALVLGAALFGDEEARREIYLSNIHIYSSPLVGTQNVIVLFFTALACFVLGNACALSLCSYRLSEYLSDYRTGRFIAGLSVLLALVGMTNFGNFIVTLLLWGIPFCVWSWLRSDPDDNWF